MEDYSQNSIGLASSGSQLGQVDQLAERATRALGAAMDLEKRCGRSRHGVELAGSVRTMCVEPLKALVDKISAKGTGWAGTSRGIGMVHGDLTRLEDLLDSFEMLVDSRDAQDDPSTVMILDACARDCLTPYLLHAGRVGLSMKPMVGFVSPGESGPGFQSTVGVSFNAGSVRSQVRWPLLASSVAARFSESLGNLGGRAAVNLGYPEPEGAISYFFATGKLTLQSLVAGWMRWLFADVCGTMQLGPAFAAGLVAGGSEGDAFKAVIDDRIRFQGAPRHVRVFAAVSALNRLGFEKEASDYWEKWTGGSIETDSIVLSTPRFPPMKLPTDRVLQAVGQMVDALLSTALRGLGGYGVTQIDGLRLTQEMFEEMRAVANDLSEGRPSSASPTMLLGAVSLASEDSGSLEGKVMRAVAASLLGDPSSTLRKGTGSEGSRGGGTILELFSSHESLARVVAVSAAVAPARGGRYGAGRR